MTEIAFVSNTPRVDRPFFDPSARYRAYAPADFFRRKGRRTTFLSQKVFERNSDAFSDASIIVFHRPSGTEEMFRYVAKNGKRQVLIADYDDLVFDVEAVNQTPAVRDRGEDPTRIARSLAANAEIGEMFNHRTASTRPLAAAASRVMGGETLVVHNGLDPTYQGIATAMKQAPEVPRRYDLGYFSGTQSHDSDLRMIAPQIAAHLDKDPARNLLIVGPVALPPALERFSAQVVRLELLRFYDMPAVIAQCRMVLGPLVDSVFAQCKSGLKFFEAAAVGTTVAATAIPDIDRFESPLLRKCWTADDWLQAFASQPPGPRERQDAQQTTIDEARIEKQMAIWASAYL